MDYKKFSLFDRIVVIVIILAAVIYFVYRTEQTNRIQNQNIAAIAAWITHNAQIGKLVVPPQYRPTIPREINPEKKPEDKKGK
jgi:hypothetical protein